MKRVNKNEVDVKIRWGSKKDDAKLLAKFFVQNVSIKYISHGEVQVGRAKTFKKWSSKLPQLLNTEISEALAISSVKQTEQVKVFIAQDEKGVQAISFGMVRINKQSKFAVLEDLVVDRLHRRRNIGVAMIEWLKKELSSMGIKRIFLESGINNTEAHIFFEKMDFIPCSKVMVSELFPKL